MSDGDKKREPFKEKPFRPGVRGHLGAGAMGALKGYGAYKLVNRLGIAGALTAPIGERIGRALASNRSRPGENWLALRDRNVGRASKGESIARAIGNTAAGAAAAYFAGRKGYRKSMNKKREKHVISEAVRRHRETVEEPAKERERAQRANMKKQAQDDFKPSKLRAVGRAALEGAAGHYLAPAAGFWAGMGLDVVRGSINPKHEPWTHAERGARVGDWAKRHGIGAGLGAAHGYQKSIENQRKEHERRKRMGL